MPNNTDTGAGAAGTQEPTGANAPDGDGSQDGKDPVSLLTSRLNGQTAKVGELSRVLSDKDKAIEALNAQIAAFQGDKIGSDEAAKAQVAAIQAKLDAEVAGRKFDILKARFPETYKELGDAMASVPETNLAAVEARLLAGGGAAEPPTPMQHGEPRNFGGNDGRPAKPETAAQIRARLEKMPSPF